MGVFFEMESHMPTTTGTLDPFDLRALRLPDLPRLCVVAKSPCTCDTVTMVRARKNQSRKKGDSRECRCNPIRAFQKKVTAWCGSSKKLRLEQQCSYELPQCSRVSTCTVTTTLHQLSLYQGKAHRSGRSSPFHRSVI